MSIIRHSMLVILFSLLLGGGYLLVKGLDSWVTLLWVLAGLYGGILLLWADEAIAYPRYQIMDGEHIGLVSRSTLFLLSFIPLAIFMLTSSGSLLGMGLILGIGLSLSLEMLALRRNPPDFRVRFLQQLKREISHQEVQFVALGFSLFVGVLAVLVVL